MDSLTDQQLNDYLESRAWEGKAGAFGYQDRLGWVHVIEGSESNVVGLPLELLEAMLSAAGYRVKRPTLAPDLRATRSRGDHGAIMTDASQDEPRQVMVRRLFPDGIPALWCPPITHYQADGRIDRVRIEAHLRYIAPYVRGLLVPGSTGDAWEMNDQEWHEILSFVVELAVEINASVLVGALESTAEATEALIRDTLCRFEQRAGMVCTSRQDTLDLLSRYRVCGFVVCGPQGDGMSQGQLFDGLQQILDLGVPTALYQLPQVTCNEIAPETAAALADRFVNFYLLKDSSGQDRIALSQACPRGVFLVRGAEGDYAQMLAAGGGPYHGLLLSSANCFAPQLAALMENLAERRMAEAQRISRNLSAAVHDAFALVARLPYGNAFANANKAMDHIMAYGNAALRNEPPLLHAGVRIPREIIEATAGVLAGYGLMPQEGYLSS
jgi:dihydrodipicolinate synthase/N-acetylneuraminate lyase